MIVVIKLPKQKKLLSTLALCFLSTLSTVEAGGNRGGFYVELEPFYSRLTDTFFSNYPLAFITVGDVTATEHNTAGSVTTFPKNNRFSYHIGVGYDLPNCLGSCNYFGYSLENTYIHNDTNVSAAVGVRNLLTGGGLPVTIGGLEPAFNALDVDPFFPPNGGAFTNVDAKFESKLDSVDLLAHYKRPILNRFCVEIATGARYLSLKENLRAHYFDSPDMIGALGLPAGSSKDYLASFNNNFEGVGATLQIKGSYSLCSQLSLIAQLEYDLILGYTDSNYSENFTQVVAAAPALSDASTFNTVYPKKTNVVPGLFGKVGLGYRVPINNRNCSTMDIEIGYRGGKYYDISDVNALIQSVNVTATPLAINRYDLENAGPYIKAAYHF
jgi:hypothetical protein